MKIIAVFLFSQLFACSANAQYQAANWPLIYNDIVLKITPGNFQENILPTDSFLFGFLANASISDAEGDLLFFSFGVDARDRNGDIMDSGYSLCESPNNPSNCIAGEDGNPHFQGALILPRPGNDSQYYLFIKDMDTLVPNDQPFRVTASLIDLSYNGGLGKVLERSVPILLDTLSDSRMTACRHANGRDWWLINHGYATNKIFTHLITPDSILGPFEQYIGAAGLEPDNSGWSVFSEDGTEFATATAGMGGICLLSFDRCYGTFNNYIFISNDSIKTYDDLAFSPNGRFLYAANDMYLMQYDLQSADMSQSGVVLVHDTAPYPLLGMMTLMSDEKVYMAGWTVWDEYLSVVDSPDLKAPDCDFHLRSVYVPNSELIDNVPNFPNYNLGPLIGSACDTLNAGIKQFPQDEGQLKVYPNPASDLINISYTIDVKATEIIVTDIAGREVQRQKIISINSPCTMDIKALANGIYFLQLKKEEEILGVAKFAKE